MAHHQFLHHCLTLAEKGRGKVGNGALVGSVLVREGKIIAEGWHAHFGAPHAEGMLLSQYQSPIEPQDILYVNLEPCCHHGKTPPCTDIILKRGVKRVIVGMMDPDERVRGKGMGLLRDAGVNVIGPVMPEVCSRFNRGFVSVRTKGRPYITLKRAQTADGRIAKPDGSPMKITDQEQDRWSHANLRAKHDAILVGIGTVLSDNPSLTIRHIYAAIQPYRIILDRDLKVLLDCKIASDTHPSRTIIITTEAAASAQAEKYAEFLKRGISVFLLPIIDDHFQLNDLWKILLQPSGEYHGITSILVEGGQKTWDFFRTEHCVDEEVTLIG